MKKHVYAHTVIILYIHAHTHKMAKMANGLGAATNVVTLAPLVLRTRTSPGRYTEALRASAFGIIPGPGLGTRVNSLIAPLDQVWCSAHIVTVGTQIPTWISPGRVPGTVNGTDGFTLSLPPRLKPIPYFTARYDGTVEIKLLANLLKWVTTARSRP